MASEQVDEPLLHWARAKLELGANATRADAQQAFLRQVAAADGYPTLDAAYAFELFTASDRAAPSNATCYVWDQLSEALEGDLDEFASHFFSHAVPQRKQRFLELQERCERLKDCTTSYYPLRTWLNALLAGLYIDETLMPPSGTDERILADELLHIFVVRPNRRPALRHFFLESRGDQIATRWRSAAKRLGKRRYRRLASLEPLLLNQLSNWRSIRPLPKPRRNAAAKTPAKSRNTRAGIPIPLRILGPILLIAASNILRQCNVEPPAQVPRSDLHRTMRDPSFRQTLERNPGLRRALEQDPNLKSLLPNVPTQPGSPPSVPSIKPPDIQQRFPPPGAKSRPLRTSNDPGIFL